MRVLTRIGLRIGMILILLAGCVHNVYHFSRFADNNSVTYPPRNHSSYGYPSASQQETYDNDETVITPNNNEENEYQEVRPSSYRY